MCFGSYEEVVSIESILKQEVSFHTISKTNNFKEQHKDSSTRPLAGSE